MDKIYLDNAATTKVDVDCFKKSATFALENYFNPSSKYHNALIVKDGVAQARSILQSRFSGYSLIFTSCGTEADNTAVFGLFKRGNAVTTQGEHSAVFQAFECLKNKGMDVRYAKLKSDGSVDEEHFLSLLDENTTFCSVVHVNNETGAINDIDYLAEKAKAIAPRLVFHSDMVQSFAKLDYTPSKYIDMFSVSAHKINAIKGVGALFYKSGLHLNPFIIGGGQEGGLRSGTENVLGILDFAYCAQKAFENLSANFERAKQLKQAFLQNLDNTKIKVVSTENSSPYIISLICEGLKGEVLQHMLDDEGVIVGTGSACSSKSPHSRVIKACGYSNKQLDGVLRVSFCFDTNQHEVAFASNKINEVVQKLYKVIYKV